jgi:hypothetical protein
MLMLVTADNLVQMFFGWEGVGLASYLLIGFWFRKPSAGGRDRPSWSTAWATLASCWASSASSGVRHGVDPEILAHAHDYAGSTIGFLGYRDTRPCCACCCSSARWASRRSLACTPGCLTRWKARPRCRR